MAIELREDLPIDYIHDELLLEAGIRFGILRLDRIHPLVSGNKWFKLKENIEVAKARGAKALLSFGGAYSNHLLAMAAAAKAYDLLPIGIVRGFHGQELPSATLLECAALGMQLVYVSREEYQRKEDPAYLQQLQVQYLGVYIIPEGGNNEAGLSGAAAIARYIPQDADLVMAAIGTGTTFAGVRNGLDSRTGMLGFPVMKGGEYLQQEIAERLQTTGTNWALATGYHFGGFARYNDELLAFMNDFYKKHHVPLDFVYTGKMLYGILDMIRRKEISGKKHVIAIHTGGLQGNRSIGHLLSYS